MRKAALYGLAVVCVYLLFTPSGPSAQRTVTGDVNGGMRFFGVTNKTFSAGVGALVASRACSTELPGTRLCEWADVFRSIPPPDLDTDVLIAQNYEVNPRTTCITSDGALKCKPGELLPAACCGITGTNPLASISLSPSTVSLLNCFDTFIFTATALGPTGAVVPGVPLFFEFSTTGSVNVTGSFTPGMAVTDANGETVTTLVIDANTCASRCMLKDCTSRIRARDASGQILSNEVQLIDQIP